MLDCRPRLQNLSATSIQQSIETYDLGESGVAREASANLIPQKANDHLIAICLIVDCYSGYRLYRGGGLVWEFLIGYCTYMVRAGLRQLWATREKSKL